MRRGPARVGTVRRHGARRGDRVTRQHRFPSGDRGRQRARHGRAHGRPAPRLAVPGRLTARARVRPAGIAPPGSSQGDLPSPVRRTGVAAGTLLIPRAGSSATGRAVSADHAIGVGYAITEDRQQGIHGQIVIVNNGSAPVSGWRVTLVLPGDRGYQVLDARNRSAGDALVMTAPADGGSLAAGGTS